MKTQRITFESLEGQYADFCRIAPTLKQTLAHWDTEYQSHE
jgi:hypothetical protein